MSGDLDGRVAVVTGAAGGLGSAIRDVFEQRGATVVGVDIVGDGCLQFDVGTAEGCRGMVDVALERHGRLDVLVLNAGGQFVAPLSSFPVPEWDRLMDVYLKGPFLAIQAAWEPLVASGRGRILATASTSSYLAEPFKAAYIAARHGLLGLLKVTALEGADVGITANAVAPAWMDTAPVRNQRAEQARLRRITEDEVTETFLARQPIKRFIEPAEVAGAFAFLASDQAAAITGTCLPVDLGTLSW